jgi:hypothetical protein
MADASKVVVNLSTWCRFALWSPLSSANSIVLWKCYRYVAHFYIFASSFFLSQTHQSFQNVKQLNPPAQTFVEAERS